MTKTKSHFRNTIIDEANIRPNGNQNSFPSLPKSYVRLYRFKISMSTEDSNYKFHVQEEEGASDKVLWR